MSFLLQFSSHTPETGTLGWLQALKCPQVRVTDVDRQLVSRKLMDSNKYIVFFFPDGLFVLVTSHTAKQDCSRIHIHHSDCNREHIYTHRNDERLIAVEMVGPVCRLFPWCLHQAAQQVLSCSLGDAAASTACVCHQLLWVLWETSQTCCCVAHTGCYRWGEERAESDDQQETINRCTL